MPKRFTAPDATGSVLVGTANPPTVEVGCQATDVQYDPGPVYVTSPGAAGLDGQLTYVHKIPALVLAWLNDAGETNSLSDFLEDNEGDTIYVRVQVSDTAAVAYTYTCQACPGGDLVGTPGQPIISTVRLPVFARSKVAV